MAPTDSPTHEQRLTDILLAYVEAVEAGVSPDRHQLLARYPEFTSELADFFGGRDQLELLVAPLREAVRAGPAKGGTSHATIVLGESLHRPASELGTLGDFRLLREIGRGGMGTVYEAEQISLNRRVALKVLPFAGALDSKHLQRFKNEAQAAAQLHHTNIVPVFAVGSERGVHYYAMQIIDGQSLASLIEELRGFNPAGKAGLYGPGNKSAPAQAPAGEQGGQSIPKQTEGPPADSPPLPWSSPRPDGQTATQPAAALSTERSLRSRTFFRRVAQLGMKAAEALEHAHQLGVVHRDIKPANLLVDVRGNLWITDFGLALYQGDLGLTLTGELVGTIRYMSPEQALAKRGLVDHRTDIYSLGVTLYELLTLQPVFDGQDRQEILRQIALEEPRPPRKLDPSIPLELETILLKTLAKNCAERYATAQELADDMQRFLEDKPIQAKRPTLLEKATKWSRRHRSLVGSALVLLVLSAIGLLVSTVLINAALEREKKKAEEAEASFYQARQIVDFFTQVSEEELTDNSALFEVRRKLLEAAVVYYQDFIDRRGDDPYLQAELAASRSRVSQLLGELSAQQDYEQLMLLTLLLTKRGVQEDLQLSSAQGEKVSTLADRLAGQRHDVVQNLRTLPPEAQQEKWQELAKTNEKAVAGILSPQQVKRLHQIALQERGPQAFNEPEVAETLGLTRDQKNTIRAFQEEARAALWEGFQHGGNGKEKRQKSQELWKNTRNNIFSVLTPDQQGRWQELTGKPFQGDLHYVPALGSAPAWSRPH